MDQTKILDVKINKITTKEVLEKIKSFLLSSQQYYIVTLNPEMIVEAQKNNHFKKIINEADIVVPDGTGILFADKFLNHRTLSEKITGIDLIYKICGSEFIKDKKIYLLGAGEGIAGEAAKVLSDKYGHLNIVGAEEGIRFEIPNTKYQIPNKSPNSKFQILNSDNNKLHRLNEKLIQRINMIKPDLVFIALGAPKDEEWIYENLKKMPSVKLAIGVGGSFDFVSGKVKRAPLILQKLGLEWLWRLILEPRRIKRIYNATVKFCWLVLRK